MLISQSQTRRQSCDRCHSRKQRCVRNSSEPCLRCKAARKECVYSPPLRPGRPRNKRTREEMKSKERGTKNGSGAVLSSMPSTAAIKRAKGPMPVNMLEDPFIANATPSTPGFEDNESDVSSWIHVPHMITPDASNTLPPNIGENTAFQRPCPNNSDVPAGNTNDLYNTVTNGMDELWMDLLGSDWQQDANDTPNAMELPSPVESLESNPTPKKPNLPIRSIHSILLLSEINLQLHKIHMPSSPQCSKWKTSLDCTIQTAQSFIQALSRLTSENNTTCKLSSARKLQTPRPTFLSASGMPKEGSKTLNSDWTSHGLHNPPLPMPFNRQVDNIVAHLALICYAQIIRCYKSLTIMLSDTLVWADLNSDDHASLLPIRIGTLEASVSPVMHIAMLAHLISYHVDELSEKLRRLGTLLVVDDESQDEAANHSLTDMIKADTHHEVEDLRDALAFVMGKLHVKSLP